jgi:acyl-CoA reductase-like NAD-dependent aldehyde dehydrogenase
MSFASSSVASLRQERRDAGRLLADARVARRLWNEQSVAARIAVLRSFRGRLAAQSRALAVMIDKRPVRDSLTGEILPLLEACRYLERHAARVLRARRSRARTGVWLRGTSVEIRREPYGTVLIIAPSNYGLMLPAAQALQALVAGNAVLIKPAPGCSAVLERFVGLLGESGLPAGLLAITDESIETAGELLRGLVDKVVFTGSSAAGQAVLSTAAEYLVPATLELSGWDACIVLESADLERAAQSIAFALVFNGGETCMAPRRILIGPERHDELVSRLVTLLGRAEPAAFAPATARPARELVEDALARGASIATGRLHPEGVSGPMLLTGVDASMPVFSTEAFGPIALVTPFDGIADAIGKANGTPFRLGATIFGDERAARRIARSLDVGVVMINDAVVPAAHPAVPLAARGASGFGTTRGTEGLLAFTRPKAIVGNRARRPLHLGPRSSADEALIEAYIGAAHGHRWRQRVAAAVAAIRTLRNRIEEKKI